MEIVTYKKTISGKYKDNRIEMIEWNDGLTIFQKVTVIPKGKRQNDGKVILYGTSPIEKKGVYIMESLYEWLKYDIKLLYNN